MDAVSRLLQLRAGHGMNSTSRTKVAESAARTRVLRIVAQDPSVLDGGRVLTAEVPVPMDRMEAGPTGHRFQVVDYDAASGRFRPPAKSLRSFARTGDGVLLADFAFHAQQVYAVAARTLAAFEFSVGRRIPWHFGTSHLFVVPHAFAEANAYYAAEDRALYFGYLPDGDRTVYTCLSQDVVAHETTHAILDGLRPRYIEPGLPDQGAFHEALADIVALLSVFSMDDVVRRMLGPADGQGRIEAGRLAPKALRKGVLLGLAEQLGATLTGDRKAALRRSAGLEPRKDWRDDPAFEEVHRRGEVVVAAVMSALLRIWRRRLEPLVHGGGMDRDRAAEEGAKAAGHLLGMVCRGIDYCPPVELEFADVLDAVLVADTQLVPDDDHGYRDTVETAFAAYGITRPVHGITDLAESGMSLSYPDINVTALRSDPDEVFRFIWANAAALGIDVNQYTCVGSVRPSVRIGPDGLLITEVVADYVQSVEGSAGELAAAGFLDLPAGLPTDRHLQLWGGGILVFDQFARARLHEAKPLGDVTRQTARMAYLVRTGQSDQRGRYGFSYGLPRGQHFAALHGGQSHPEERW